MLGLKSLTRGGIQPLTRKLKTRDQQIWNAAIPSLSVVPLRQHPGPAARALVAKGDVVREGMMIGRAENPLAAHVHSPVPGVVREIREITLADGSSSPAVFIELGGEFDRLGKPAVVHPWDQLTPARLLAALQDAGVVGMGGEMQPVHSKYQLPDGVSLDALVINGAECEPYVSCEHRIMLERTDELVEGMQILHRILGPRRVHVGVQKDKRDALDALAAATEKAGVAYHVTSLPLRYPAGDEKQLVRTLLGHEVPSGGTPLDVGALVVNISTVLAVYEAVALRKPLFERVVTVAGGAIRRPGNLKVRIGITVGELIQECGGLTEMPARIVVGGPLRGSSIDDMDTPITKGTSAVLALLQDEIHEAPHTACIQCGRCVRACPMGLQPIQLKRLLDHGRNEDARANGLLDCQECGSCSYVCPAHIPLAQSLRNGRSLVLKNIAAEEHE